MGVLKISKQGFDVLGNGKEKKLKVSIVETPNHMYSVLVLIFLNGARKQLERYREIVKNKDISSLVECIHDAINLFEDLNTLGKYIEKCGDKTHSKKNKLWLDIRNHLRHDVREEFDNENGKEKNGRAGRLKLDPKFQIDMKCEFDYVGVGGIKVMLKEIDEYLDWVDDFFKNMWNGAMENGFIKLDDKKL